MQAECAGCAVAASLPHCATPNASTQTKCVCHPPLADSVLAVVALCPVHTKQPNTRKHTNPTHKHTHSAPPADSVLAVVAPRPAPREMQQRVLDSSRGGGGGGEEEEEAELGFLLPPNAPAW